jgi:hypothetical protein
VQRRRTKPQMTQGLGRASARCRGASENRGRGSADGDGVLLLRRGALDGHTRRAARCGEHNL